MRICKQCGDRFSTRIKIDDKSIPLSNRWKCYSCKPYKPRQICEKCGNRHMTSRCGVKKYNKIDRKLWKSKLVEYKGGQCCKCGYNKCLRALCFHHIDETTKSFGISQMYIKMEKIKLEADKCLLLCHNCHMELHDGLWDVKYLAVGKVPIEDP
jgi:hypothetical protein